MAEWLSAVPAIHGVEIVLPMAFVDPAVATDSEVMAQRRLWNDHGLEITSVQSLAYGRPDLQLFGSRSVRARFVAHLERMAEVAAGLGAPHMVFGSPANRRRGALPLADAMRTATVFFKEVAQRIQHTGVTLSIEPNPPIYSECDFVVHLSEAIELVRAIDDPRVRVQVDTGSIAYDIARGEKIPRAMVLDAIALAGHMHVSMPGLHPLHANDADQAAISRWGVPWAEIKSCSIEMRTPEDTDPRTTLTEAIAAVMDWYHPQVRS